MNIKKVERSRQIGISLELKNLANGELTLKKQIEKLKNSSVNWGLLNL
jgi:hypothetical protein